MIIQIYGIRTVEDARMVVELGATNIGVSYGKIKRTPGQVTCEKAREIFENVQPTATKVGLTIAEDIEEISENLREVEPDILHLSGYIEAITPEAVLSQLAAAGVLPSDTTVLSFTKKEKDGEQVIDLDLSEKFGTYIKEMGSSAEYLAIGSICNTYLDVYHCAKIHITVNGEMLATGHAEYPGYMTRFS